MHLKHPTLLSFHPAWLLVAACAAGCGGNVVRQGGGGGHAGWPHQSDNPPGCPADEGELGKPCQLGGATVEPLTCAYEHAGCTNAITCEAGAWTRSRVYGSCADCPEAQPGQSTACSPPFITCIYPGSSCDYYAECGKHGLWIVQGESPGCAIPCPPAPPVGGSACEPWMGPCTYPVDTPCGTMDQQATCDGGSWKVSQIACP